MHRQVTQSLLSMADTLSSLSHGVINADPDTLTAERRGIAFGARWLDCNNSLGTVQPIAAAH